MTKTLLDFNLKLAKEAGNSADGQSYLDEYKYHLGAKDEPLPFNIWRIKFDLLIRVQSIPETSPRYLAPSTFRIEQKLCSALGY